MKRRRDIISDGFAESPKRRARGQANSFSRNSRVSQRFDSGRVDGDADTFNSRRKKVENRDLMNGRKGGKGMDSGFRRDGKAKRGKRDFVDDMEDEGDIDDNESGGKELIGHLNDLVDEESDDPDEDVQDDGMLKRNATSSFGSENYRPLSPEKSDSYLSESRYDK